MKNRFNPSNLDIIQFKIVSGQIHSPYNFKTKAIDNYATDMNFSVGFNVKKKTARSTIEFEIETESSNKQEESNAKFCFVFIFSISNFEDMVELKKNKISSINDNLTTAIAAISFSTSRGVLLSRLQGTVMSKYILPIIDPVDLKE